MSTTEGIVSRLLDEKQSVATRMRAIFGLKGLGGEVAVKALEKSLLSDSSALVRHEVAYVLGQMREVSALPTLVRVLDNVDEDVMVRHEAAEAMGAIADVSVLAILDRYAADVTIAREVRETCIIAAERVRWASTLSGSEQTVGADACGSIGYTSVDPAPPVSLELETKELRAILCDGGRDMFERYRAMFALRNRGGDDAVRALCHSMEEERESALFRHEVAYVLGQMQSPVSIPTLAKFLRDQNEHEMVRHEAAEALGSVGTEEAEILLAKFQEDKADVVRESVEVALDISEYVASDELHYTDTVLDSAQHVVTS